MKFKPLSPKVSGTVASRKKVNEKETRTLTSSQAHNKHQQPLAASGEIHQGASWRNPKKERSKSYLRRLGCSVECARRKAFPMRIFELCVAGFAFAPRERAQVHHGQRVTQRSRTCTRRAPRCAQSESWRTKASDSWELT